MDTQKLAARGLTIHHIMLASRLESSFAWACKLRDEAELEPDPIRKRALRNEMRVNALNARYYLQWMVAGEN